MTGTTLAAALDALEAAVGARLPDWQAYQGLQLEVTTPGFVVGLPLSASYGSLPQNRAEFELPLTFVVDVADSLRLLDALSPDGLVADLQGATSNGWWGALQVTTGEVRGPVPNGNSEAVVADLTITLYC